MQRKKKEAIVLDLSINYMNQSRLLEKKRLQDKKEELPGSAEVSNTNRPWLGREAAIRYPRPPLMIITCRI